MRRVKRLLRDSRLRDWSQLLESLGLGEQRPLLSSGGEPPIPGHVKRCGRLTLSQAAVRNPYP